jgi:ComF family protein
VGPQKSLSYGSITCTLIKNKSIRVEQAGKIWVYNLLMKPFCKKCSHPVLSEFEKKGLCHAGLYGFKRAYAIGPYFRKEYSDLVEHIWKLKSKAIYAVPLGLSMALCVENLYPELKRINLLVPVPAHPNKNKERGYNQAELLTRILSDKLHVPYESDILAQIKPIKMQDKKREERKNIVKGAFAINRHIKEKSVILIDDVLTTGFTASECSKLLLDAGAKEVYVLVVARRVWEK